MNLLIVEGDGDRRFLEDFVCTFYSALHPKLELVPCGGYTRLPSFKNKFLEAGDSGGILAVIFDADDNMDRKRQQIVVESRLTRARSSARVY